jgi:hypothetical protein
MTAYTLGAHCPEQPHSDIAAAPLPNPAVVPPDNTNT